MAEHETLKEHIEDIREAVRKRNETAKKKQDIIDRHEAKVKHMNDLASRFAVWATRYGVPFDYYKKVGLKKKGYWLFTSDHGGSADSLGVDEHGEIDARLEVKPTRAREYGKIDFFWPGGEVYQRIAEICVASELDSTTFEEIR